MDIELKAKWLKVLRGGKIKQGRGRLKHSPTRMCCLGVLRHLADPKDSSSNLGNGLKLSPSQLAVFGLTNDQQTRLARMNDGQDNGTFYSFREIADYVEKKL